LKILLSEICEEIEIQILAVECDKDHCHVKTINLPMIEASK